MLFSIIIPTYNRAELLRIAIQSVIDQTYSDWELLIIDDASTDHTQEIVAQFDDERILYHYQTKQERSAARNKGIEKARGEYICFIDDDDYIKNNYLNKFWEAKHDYPNHILRTGFIYQFPKKIKSGKLFDPDIYKHPVHFALKEMCGVWSLCIPRKYLDEDKFPDFPHWQDAHLILRLFAKFPVKQLPHFNYVYVQHEAMGTQKLFKSNSSIDQRLALNLAAIKDFFHNHYDLIQSIVPAKMEQVLLSQKVMHYANSAANYGNRLKARELFFRSLKLGVFPGSFKLYLVFIKNYFKVKKYSKMDPIFEKIQDELTQQGFTFERTDFNRPWGGFFVIEENQSEKFCETYYPDEDVAQLTKGGRVSPKILVVLPGKRLSWQYHHRRSEVWKLIDGESGVIRSDTDEQKELEIMVIGENVVLQCGERHRLVGLDNVGIIAEIWQHVDPKNPSDEDDIVRVQDDFGR